MTNRTKYLIFALITIIAFAFGRYLGQQQVTKSQTDIQTNEITKRRTVIVKDKDGREVTTIDERIDATERIKQSQQIGVKRKSFNVSALVAIQDGKLYAPTYGVSVSGEVIGPITVGAFGLINGTLGLSLGLNF